MDGKELVKCMIVNVKNVLVMIYDTYVPINNHKISLEGVVS